MAAAPALSGQPRADAVYRDALFFCPANRPAYAEVQRPDERPRTAPVAAELRRGAQHKTRR